MVHVNNPWHHGDKSKFSFRTEWTSSREVTLKSGLNSTSAYSGESYTPVWSSKHVKAPACLPQGTCEKVKQAMQHKSITIQTQIHSSTRETVHKMERNWFAAVLKITSHFKKYLLTIKFGTLLIKPTLLCFSHRWPLLNFTGNTRFHF